MKNDPLINRAHKWNGLFTPGACFARTYDPATDGYPLTKFVLAYFVLPPVNDNTNLCGVGAQFCWYNNVDLRYRECTASFGLSFGDHIYFYYIGKVRVTNDQRCFKEQEDYFRLFLASEIKIPILGYSK